MAEQTHVVKYVQKVRGRDLQGKMRVLDKTQPQQLVLFQTLLPEDDPDENFSNTIEFYDAIPKYFSNPRLMDSMRKDGIYLPRLERDFQHRGETYKVTIRPARLTGRDGMDKEYYPGPREELVEEALRKLACDRLNGVYLDDQAGVQFTIEFIPITPLAAMGSSAPGSCAGHSRVPSRDHGPPASTGGAGLSRCDSA